MDSRRIAEPGHIAHDGANPEKHGMKPLLGMPVPSQAVWVLLSAVLAMFLLPASTDAHVGDRVFPIYELPTSDLPDLHDGTLADWAAVLEPSLDQGAFYATILDGAIAGGVPVEDRQLTFEVYLAWLHASQRLFIGIDRYDVRYDLRLPASPLATREVVYTDDDPLGCCWSYDNVELHVDGDYGGEACMAQSEGSGSSEEIARRRQTDNVACQVYTMVPEARGARLIGASGYGPPWALDPPYLDAGGSRFGELPTQSGHEAYVTPWDELRYELADSRRSHLEPGAIVGFQLGVFDYDDTADWLAILKRSMPPFSYSEYTLAGAYLTRLASDFVDGLLIPCAVGDCSGSSPSAVRPDSWARIKVALTC